MTGKIKTLVNGKDFGFILGDDGKEYFFHKSSAVDFDLLMPGVIVEFTPTKGKKGPRAENVIAS